MSFQIFEAKYIHSLLKKPMADFQSCLDPVVGGGQKLWVVHMIVAMWR